jgi:hypothetical protein
METSFKTDLDFSESEKNKLKCFYKNMTCEGRFVFIKKGDKYKSLGSDQIQKQMCVDTIAQISDEESILVEEKYRRVDYGDLLVETKSCTNIGFEKAGWIYTSKADFLVYVVPTKAYIINMKKLKDFYLQNQQKYRRKKTNQINQTEFFCVPWKDLKNTIGYKEISL